MNKKKVAMAVGAIALSVATSPAMAANTTPTFNGAAIYKDSLGNVYIAPGTSNTSVSMAITGANVTKAYSTDRCGEFVLKFSPGVTPPATITVDAASVTLSTSTSVVSKDWTCDKTAGTITPKQANATVPSTTTPIVNIGNTYYFFKTPLTQHLVEYSGNVTKNVRINACGFGKLSYTAAQAFPSTATIGASSGTPAALAMSAMTVAPGAPTCKSGVLSLPAGWVS